MYEPFITLASLQRVHLVRSAQNLAAASVAREYRGTVKRFALIRNKLLLVTNRRNETRSTNEIARVGR